MQDAKALKAMTTKDLQNAPIDLHILGKYNVPGLPNWRAEGTYLNDDGLSTQLAGNVNQYRLVATYSQTGGESIILSVGNTMNATNYLNKNTNCSAVNNADYLQSIYIYNATSFKQHSVWFVSVAYNQDVNNYQTIGQAAFDAATNRIVFDGPSQQSAPICLSNVFRIALKNFA
jgi:hypothetical protein